MVVFWLEAPDDVLADRIGTHDQARPPLLEDAAQRPLDPLEECRRLRTERTPFYRTLSDHRIEADAPTAEVVQMILDTGIANPGADT